MSELFEMCFVKVSGTAPSPVGVNEVSSVVRPYKGDNTSLFS